MTCARRNVRKEVKDILDRCELDDNLPNTEIEEENERLKSLIDKFVEKSIDCLNMLNKGTEGNNNEIIEDLNAHVEIV